MIPNQLSISTSFLLKPPALLALLAALCLFQTAFGQLSPSTTAPATATPAAAAPTPATPYTTPATPYWQQQVNYTIHIALNDIEHALDGNLSLRYRNNSPDTLTFIWFHCWPNAFKNDRTAFSDQRLENGKKDFYFSDKQDRGYINHLDFNVDGAPAKTLDHPRYIDIIELVLPHPLPPGGEITITTPFHTQIPKDFGGGGHMGQSYRLIHWYPQAAVYDRDGWHPAPYLDQGGSYDEFGEYDVTISLPANYTVAASGEEMADSDTSSAVNDPLPPLPGKSSAPADGNQKIGRDRKNPPARNATPASPPAPKDHKPKPLPAKTPAPKILADKTLADKTPAHKTLAHKTLADKIPFSLRVPPSDTRTRTLHFKETNASGFAWLADKRYIKTRDTLRLPSGKTIHLVACYSPASATYWARSIGFAKQALRFYSNALGDYPLNTITLAEWPAPQKSLSPFAPAPYIRDDSRQDPTPGIAFVETPGRKDFFRFDRVFNPAISHSIGQSWFTGFLGPDGYSHPWMQTGLAAYYERRYLQSENAASATDRDWLLAENQIGEKEDQPVNTSSADFSALNYRIIAHAKAAIWMQGLEKKLGTPSFDKSMQEYFSRWQFRHPRAEDLQTSLANGSGKNLAPAFALLDQKGLPDPNKPSDPLSIYPKRPALPYLPAAYSGDSDRYMGLQPVFLSAGYNEYDKAMVGLLFSNLTLPGNRFKYVFTPLYAFGSKQINGALEVNYTLYPQRLTRQEESSTRTGHGIRTIELGLGGERFSSQSALDSNNHRIFGGFYKITPSVRLYFNKSNPRSTAEKWIDWRTFLIGEKGFDTYVQKSTDSQYYPVKGSYAFRYLNQLSFHINDERALYPYNGQLQFQQASNFYRVNLTGNYFFNYSAGGGMAVRVFAAKFGYLGSRHSSLGIYAYEPKLTAVKGSEDYTYSNYFLGRNEFTGFASQQVMIRDGGLKIRMDAFPFAEGRSDNWIAAMNFNTTLPPHLFPFPVPLKIFLDAGTYAEAWQNNPPTSKFLYVGGLQLSLLHNRINFYAPLFYSSDFRDQLKTVPDQNTFFKKLSFSIDFQISSLRKTGMARFFKNTQSPSFFYQ